MKVIFSAGFLFFLGATACRNADDADNGSDVNVANANKKIADAPTEYVTKSTVYLQIQKKFGCSAVIVGKSRILTAKHCVDTSRASDVEVVFGVDLERAVAILPVRNLRLHQSSDLATVDLTGALPSGFKPVPIFAPQSSQLVAGKQAVVAGYGYVGGKDANNPLGKVQFLRWGYVNFDAWYAQFTSEDGYVFRSVLRWLPGQAGSMLCYGDSGGPMFANFNGAWGLVGVNSMTEKGCVTGGYTSDPRPNIAWINGG